MAIKRLELLLELLRQPTSPFREEHVIAVAASTLRTNNVPFFLDPIGNLVIGCASYTDYDRLLRAHALDPICLFVAHMDHPGFHGAHWQSDRRLKVKWYGGSPVKHLTGAPVWLASASGWYTNGKLMQIRLLKSGHAINTAVVHLDTIPTGTRPTAVSLYGGFNFRAPVWRQGRRLYTKAADDLVGVFAIINTALEAFTRRKTNRPPFIGLLTRAEEVGFVGAIAHFERGWLKRARRPVVCISLETSRTLPQAVIGKGPVVRLGDRRTVFDPAMLNVLTRIAQRNLPGRHQRRIMDGGSCEAFAATVYGLPAIGISVPLGNYHNQGFEGGPDCRAQEGPAPEFVHLDDVEGLLTLCRALLARKLPWTAPWKTERLKLKQHFQKHKRLLDLYE